MVEKKKPADWDHAINPVESFLHGPFDFQVTPGFEERLATCGHADFATDGDGEPDVASGSSLPLGKPAGQASARKPRRRGARVRKLVLCVDSNVESDLVAEWGLRLARQLRARVIVLTVDEGSSGQSAGDESPRALLAKFEEMARRSGVEVSSELAQGVPDAEILALAAREDADLIVMGARSHGLVASLLKGSVSQRVLQQARCPVLIYGDHVGPAQA